MEESTSPTGEERGTDNPRCEDGSDGLMVMGWMRVGKIKRVRREK